MAGDEPDDWYDISVKGFSPTAYGLTNENSKTKGRRFLFKVLGLLKPGETLILFYGEVDARFHITRRDAGVHPLEENVHKLQDPTHNESDVERSIDDTVRAYGSVLLEIRAMGKDDQIIVHGICPVTTQYPISPITTQQSSAALDDLRTRIYKDVAEQQKCVYLTLNAKLKEFCEKNGFRYYDVMPLVGPTGLLEPMWDLGDGVHLKKDAVELFKRYLLEVGL